MIKIINIIISSFRNSIWFFIPLLFVTLTTFTMLKFGKHGVYYTIDPDIVYLSNALLYIKSGILAYYDHPGTPAINILSASLVPLRVYAKIIVNSDFISWTFNNFTYLVLYSRLIQAFIFTLSVYVFGVAVYTLTKSRIVQTIAVLMLFGFKPIYYAIMSISAEPTTMLLTSLYLLSLSVFYKTKKYMFGYILIFLSGLMFSSRATTFFYIPLSIVIFFNIIKIPQKKTILRFATRLFLIFSGGFLLGAYPLKTLFLPMILRILYFAQSGQIHGGGDFININNLIISWKTFLYTDPFATTIFLIVSLLSIKNLKGKNYFSLTVAFVGIVGALVVAKLPLSHYQVPNYMLLVYILSLEIEKISNFNKMFLLFVTILGIVNVYFVFNSEFQKSILQTVKLGTYVDSNKTSKSTLWEWARSENFSKLWIRDKSGGIFDKELNEISKTYELLPDLRSIRINSSSHINLSEFCWDTLYLQSVSLEKFIQINKPTNFDYSPVDGSHNLIVVKSKHCEE